jgi:hypothetical protein
MTHRQGGGGHTEVICHELLFQQRMLGTDSHDRLARLHGLETLWLTGSLSPSELLLQYVKHGNDILQGTDGKLDYRVMKQGDYYIPLKRNITVCDGYHGHIEVLGRAAEGQ